MVYYSNNLSDDIQGRVARNVAKRHELYNYNKYEVDSLFNLQHVQSSITR